jgi:hypothetical protein
MVRALLHFLMFSALLNMSMGFRHDMTQEKVGKLAETLKTQVASAQRNAGNIVRVGSHDESNHVVFQEIKVGAKVEPHMKSTPQGDSVDPNEMSL